MSAELLGEIGHQQPTGGLLVEDETAAARSEARTHLDIAIAELQDMHMQPALERTLALRNKLRTPQVQPRIFRPSDMPGRHTTLTGPTNMPVDSF